MGKYREFGVIINEYGLALPTGNTQPTNTVIEKAAFTEAVELIDLCFEKLKHHSYFEGTSEFELVQKIKEFKEKTNDPT